LLESEVNFKPEIYIERNEEGWPQRITGDVTNYSRPNYISNFSNSNFNVFSTGIPAKNEFSSPKYESQLIGWQENRKRNFTSLTGDKTVMGNSDHLQAREP
jgi:hypothetical protein